MLTVDATMRRGVPARHGWPVLVAFGDVHGETRLSCTAVGSRERREVEGLFKNVLN
jgi:hypothetical protein